MSARNILPGKIQDLDVKSERTWVSIRVEQAPPCRVKITHEAREELQLKENLEVYCVIKASAINRLWD